MLSLHNYAFLHFGEFENKKAIVAFHLHGHIRAVFPDIVRVQMGCVTVKLGDGEEVAGGSGRGGAGQGTVGSIGDHGKILPVSTGDILHLIWQGTAVSVV